MKLMQNATIRGLALLMLIAGAFFSFADKVEATPYKCIAECGSHKGCKHQCISTFDSKFDSCLIGKCGDDHVAVCTSRCGVSFSTCLSSGAVEAKNCLSAYSACNKGCLSGANSCEKQCFKDEQ